MEHNKNSSQPKPAAVFSFGKAVRLALWGIALGASLWLYVYPIDHFTVEERSEFRVPFVANSQQGREQEIANRVKQLVDEIKFYWAQNFPDEPMGELGPPASEKDIALLEHRYGPLPLDYKAFLRLHNGQVGVGGFYSYQELCTIQKSLEWSNDVLSIGDSVHYQPLTYEDVWFHPGVCFIAESDGSGQVINVANGKIYSWDHDGGPLSEIADSFTAMLEKMAFGLKNKLGPHARWVTIPEETAKMNSDAKD